MSKRLLGACYAEVHAAHAVHQAAAVFVFYLLPFVPPCAAQSCYRSSALQARHDDGVTPICCTARTWDGGTRCRRVTSGSIWRSFPQTQALWLLVSATHLIDL